MRLLLITVLYFAPVMNAAQNRTWDTIIFSQTWPISSCINHLIHDPAGSCNLLPNMTTWTIHGIWPNKVGTFGPFFCNNSWHFDEKQIVSIEPYLIKYWSNIYGDSSFTSLWSHEWSKHGTCAAQLPQLDNERKYFEKGLEWVTQYDILDAFTRNNIFPSDLDTLSTKIISQALKDAFGVDAAIHCIYDKKRKLHILSEIRLCLEPSLKLVNCDGILNVGKDELGNCPTEGVTYPATVRNGDIKYSYPRKLAVAHTRGVERAKYECNSWTCRALAYVSFISWMTL